VLTKRLFGASPGIVSVRSRDQHGGHQDFGERAFRLTHPPGGPSPLSNVITAFAEHDVRRIVCIPCFAEDAATGVALKRIFPAPLCTYVMDDNNVEVAGIPDGLLRDLLELSELRLAISGELRDAYERKFGLTFYVVPPLVEPSLVLDAPAVPSREQLEAHGVIVGNIWGAEWLELLRATLRGTGIELDWYCNGRPSATVTDAELAQDGIHLRAALPEAELTSILRRTPFVLLPSGTLDERDSRRGIARLSLPSRIPYVFATSHTPTIVLGHPDTAAARFVTSQGVGLWAPYDRDRLRAAIAEIRTPAAQATLRSRAASLARSFSSEGAREWLWRSLEAGRAIDDRWERLAPRAAEKVAS
jgi:hypothetical protein